MLSTSCAISLLFSTNDKSASKILNKGRHRNESCGRPNSFVATSKTWTQTLGPDPEKSRP